MASQDSAGGTRRGHLRYRQTTSTVARRLIDQDETEREQVAELDLRVQTRAPKPPRPTYRRCTYLVAGMALLDERDWEQPVRS